MSIESYLLWDSAIIRTNRLLVRLKLMKDDILEWGLVPKFSRYWARRKLHFIRIAAHTYHQQLIMFVQSPTDPPFIVFGNQFNTLKQCSPVAVATLSLIDSVMAMKNYSGIVSLLLKVQRPRDENNWELQLINTLIAAIMISHSEAYPAWNTKVLFKVGLHTSKIYYEVHILLWGDMYYMATFYVYGTKMSTSG